MYMLQGYRASLELHEAARRQLRDHVIQKLAEELRRFKMEDVADRLLELFDSKLFTSGQKLTVYFVSNC